MKITHVHVCKMPHYSRNICKTSIQLWGNQGYSLVVFKVPYSGRLILGPNNQSIFFEACSYVPEFLTTKILRFTSHTFISFLVISLCLCLSLCLPFSFCLSPTKIHMNFTFFFTKECSKFYLIFVCCHPQQTTRAQLQQRLHPITLHADSLSWTEAMVESGYLHLPRGNFPLPYKCQLQYTQGG